MQDALSGLKLPVRTALGRDAFFVSPANHIAVAMIDAWPGWSGGKMVLTGPAGAGKTHLAHVWASEAGARIVQAGDLAGADIPALAAGPIAVEDVPDIAGDAEAEQALFHLHNLVLAEGHTLLMTGAPPARHWGLALPDLASRVEACASAALGLPDDALLAAVLGKLFRDRQLAVGEDVVKYLVRRIDRSFDAARSTVETLDAEALAARHRITRSFAARVLGEGQADRPSDPDTPDA